MRRPEIDVENIMEMNAFEQEILFTQDKHFDADSYDVYIAAKEV